MHPDQLPVEYGGTGKYGFKSIRELFDSEKSFAAFESPEFNAVLEKDFNRTALNLGKEGAIAAAARLLEHSTAKGMGDVDTASLVNPKGVGYVRAILVLCTWLRFALTISVTCSMYNEGKKVKK